MVNSKGHIFIKIYSYWNLWKCFDRALIANLLIKMHFYTFGKGGLVQQYEKMKHLLQKYSNFNICFPKFLNFDLNIENDVMILIQCIVYHMVAYRLSYCLILLKGVHSLHGQNRKCIPGMSEYSKMIMGVSNYINDGWKGRKKQDSETEDSWRIKYEPCYEIFNHKGSQTV